MPIFDPVLHDLSGLHENSQINNGRKGTREASKSLLPPCSLSFDTNACTSIFLLPEGWGIQNPPPIATNGSNYTRGFHIFILILRLIGYIFRNQKAEL